MLLGSQTTIAEDEIQKLIKLVINKGAKMMKNGYFKGRTILLKS